MGGEEALFFCLLLCPWNYSSAVVLVSGTGWNVSLMSFRLPESLYLQGTFFFPEEVLFLLFSVCFRSCIKYYKQNPLDEQHIFQLPVRPTAVKSLYQSEKPQKWKVEISGGQKKVKTVWQLSDSAPVDHLSFHKPDVSELTLNGSLEERMFYTNMVTCSQVHFKWSVPMESSVSTSQNKQNNTKKNPLSQSLKPEMYINLQGRKRRNVQRILYERWIYKMGNPVSALALKEEHQENCGD